MADQNAIALRRRLRAELRAARMQAQLSERAAAEAMNWPAAQIIEIETGAHAVSISELEALLHVYGVSDRSRISELIALAGVVRPSPWLPFADVFSRPALQYFDYEASAGIMRSFESTFVQGLLQTEGYCRALLADIFGHPAASIDRLIEARLRRQEVLADLDGRTFHFIFDEAVIRRVVGGPVVMREQLLRLAELAVHPSITVQIVQFSAGGHQGLRGPFTCLEFPVESSDDLLYLENSRGDAVFREDPEEITVFREIFSDLEAVASRPADLNAILDSALAALPPGV